MEFTDLKAQQVLIRELIETRMACVLDHGRYINGPEVAELETALAAFVGAKHCITCANGTDALQIAQMALGIEPGDEVITPGFSYIATAETISLLGAKPVFVEVDSETFTLDVAAAEAAITNKTRAIIPVSLFGQCANMPEIVSLAERHNLSVIEDAAQSLGASIGNQRSCNLSLIGCTSFFPSKPLGCYGDGGAVFTNDDELALKIRQIATHGQDRRYHHVRLGVNSRLDTLQAAILLAKFSIFPQEIIQRQQAADHYNTLFDSVEEVQTPVVPSGYQSVYAQYTLQLNDRDEVARKIREAGVPVAIHYPIPLHRQPAMSNHTAQLKRSELLSSRVLSLPMHPYLSADTIGQIVETVKNSLTKGY